MHSSTVIPIYNHYILSEVANAALFLVVRTQISAESWISNPAVKKCGPQKIIADRLTVKALNASDIETTILTGPFQGQYVFIPLLRLTVFSAMDERQTKLLKMKQGRPLLVTHATKHSNRDCIQSLELTDPYWTRRCPSSLL
jgi:hypothetical protein